MLQAQFVLAEVSLPELAYEINREHQLCSDAMGDAVQHAIRVGELLIEAKAKCQHGEWLGWVEANCNFTDRTAQRYMRIAWRREEVESNATRVSHLQDAIDLLAEPKEKPPVLFEPHQYTTEFLNNRATWQPGHDYGIENQVKNDSPELRDVFIEPSKPHVANNSGNNEWYTPPEYIEAARLVMGGIDLDPASSDIANRTVKAEKYYTADDDGLVKEWAGKVWMNPPYSADLIGRFTEKLASSYSSGDVAEAIVLVNNATETGWFKAMADVAAAVVFVKGRIKYLNSIGQPENAPLQGQAILYFGTNISSFIDVFRVFGWCAIIE